MMYVLSIIFAGLIVAGQSLWKVGIERLAVRPNLSYFFSREVVNILTSPYMISGFLIYGAATFLYIGLIGRFDYSVVQSLTIPLTLIIAYIVAGSLFKESISSLNLIGLTMIIVGVVLAVRR